MASSTTTCGASLAVCAETVGRETTLPSRLAPSPDITLSGARVLDVSFCSRSPVAGGVCTSSFFSGVVEAAALVAFFLLSLKLEMERDNLGFRVAVADELPSER